MSSTTVQQSELIAKAETASLLGVSQKHVERMSESGRMPKPIRLGRALRWRRAELMQWLGSSCPDLRRSEVDND